MEELAHRFMYNSVAFPAPSTKQSALRTLIKTCSGFKN